ncbi:MAG: heme oxygenase [Pycnora praestabilis]|nr:MAG: heme oxygenase [Pycnora praestabilis]
MSSNHHSRDSALPAQINEATREAHTHLNRLITARLPLALPPSTFSPKFYAIGLLHFAHVYITFESLWSSLLLDSNESLLRTREDGTDRLPKKSCRRMHGILSHLRLPELLRAKRIRDDLAVTLSLSKTDLAAQLKQLQCPRVRQFVAHIEDVVRDKPHVLVAYAWVMYMALFSGGRWIRAQLLAAGEEFWRASYLCSAQTEEGTAIWRQSPDYQSQVPGLEFLHFDGMLDGEDIKMHFKQRLYEVEDIFTAQEREDIAEEALNIFHLSILLVEELDGLVDSYTKPDDLSTLLATFNRPAVTPPRSRTLAAFCDWTWLIQYPFSQFADLACGVQITILALLEKLGLKSPIHVGQQTTNIEDQDNMEPQDVKSS